MIVGEPSVLAIESGITHAYERLSFLGLGFFVIHVGGCRYGVYSPDATMLACSLDEVETRIADRGKHIASFATESDAGKIAHAFRNALYADEQEDAFFGMPHAEFAELFGLGSSDLTWAPDGDAAFDDGSYVLQFDVQDRVRLIAFKSKGWSYDPTTLKDVWLPADGFYDILQRWHSAFVAEWRAMPKTPEL